MNNLLRDHSWSCPILSFQQQYLQYGHGQGNRILDVHGYVGRIAEAGASAHAHEGDRESLLVLPDMVIGDGDDEALVAAVAIGPAQGARFTRVVLTGLCRTAAVA